MSGRDSEEGGGCHHTGGGGGRQLRTGAGSASVRWRNRKNEGDGSSAPIVGRPEAEPRVLERQRSAVEETVGGLRPMIEKCVHLEQNPSREVCCFAVVPPAVAAVPSPTIATVAVRPCPRASSTGVAIVGALSPFGGTGRHHDRLPFPATRWRSSDAATPRPQHTLVLHNTAHL